MTFEIGKADGFEVPLTYVNQCIAGKNEATLEFHLNEDAPVNLSEMRFFIPGTELAGDDPVEAFKEKVWFLNYIPISKPKSCTHIFFLRERCTRLHFLFLR